MLLKGTFASPLLKHRRESGEKKRQQQAIAKLFALHANAISLQSMTLQFKRRDVKVFYCVDLTSVYSVTIGKFVLTSVSASD